MTGEVWLKLMLGVPSRLGRVGRGCGADVPGAAARYANSEISWFGMSATLLVGDMARGLVLMLELMVVFLMDLRGSAGPLLSPARTVEPDDVEE
jgi:hypothetical protein